MIQRRALLTAAAAPALAALSPARKQLLLSPASRLPPGLSLDLSFLNPGSLPPGVTFTRASTATYFDATGTLQTAATNAPRWDYDPVTHALRGLLIEEARTNVVLQSSNIANAAWGVIGFTVAAPVVTANQVTAPDGTVTAARVVLPAVSAAGNGSIIYQQPTVTAAVYTLSLYMRGSVGGEQLYLTASSGTGFYYSSRFTLTTAWQRFSFTPPALTAAGWFFEIGTDMRDGTQTSTPAQTIFVWGAQFEAGAFATSYIPTAGAAATRAVEVCTMPTAAWFSATAGTLSPEFIYKGQATGGFCPVVAFVGASTNNDSIHEIVQQSNLSFQGVVRTGGTTVAASASFPNVLTVGAVTKTGLAYTSAVAIGAMNGTLAPQASVTGALPVITALWFMQPNVAFQLQLSGHMRRVRYWPRALSNAELQSVTT